MSAPFIKTYATDVVAMIRAGRSNREIVAVVGCSPNYVRVVRQRFCRDTLRKPTQKPTRKILTRKCLDCQQASVSENRKRCHPCQSIHHEALAAKRTSVRERELRLAHWRKRLEDAATEREES